MKKKWHFKPDEDEIDAYFDILINGKPGLAVMESKNHENNLKIQLFYEISIKSLKYKKKINLNLRMDNTTILIPIHFTICQSISEFKKSKTYTSAIKKLANSNENRINISNIRPKNSEEYGFNLIPAFEDFKIHSIIVELKVLQEFFGVQKERNQKIKLD